MPSNETVLVATSNCRDKFHLPDEDDETEPRCNRAGLEVGQFKPRDPDTLPDKFELCRFCDPDYEVARPGHPEGGTLASKLDDADPDELVTDGGQVVDESDGGVSRRQLVAGAGLALASGGSGFVLGNQKQPQSGENYPAKFNNHMESWNAWTGKVGRDGDGLTARVHIDPDDRYPIRSAVQDVTGQYIDFHHKWEPMTRLEGSVLSCGPATSDVYYEWTFQYEWFEERISLLGESPSVLEVIQEENGPIPVLEFDEQRRGNREEYLPGCGFWSDAEVDR